MKAWLARILRCPGGVRDDLCADGGETSQCRALTAKQNGKHKYIQRLPSKYHGSRTRIWWDTIYWISFPYIVQCTWFKNRATNCPNVKHCASWGGHLGFVRVRTWCRAYTLSRRRRPAGAYACGPAEGMAVHRFFPDFLKVGSRLCRVNLAPRRSSHLAQRTSSHLAQRRSSHLVHGEHSAGIWDALRAHHVHLRREMVWGSWDVVVESKVCVVSWEQRKRRSSSVSRW